MLLSANTDACLNVGAPIDKQSAVGAAKGKGVRFEEASTPTMDKELLMDYITQLLEEKMSLRPAKRMPACGTPGRLSGLRFETSLESDEEELEVGHDCGKRYPALPGKRAFEEDEEDEDMETTMVTPKRRRMVDGVDNMKAKKIKRTRDVKAHVMSDECAGSDEVERVYIPLRRGAGKCAARLLEATGEEDEDI